VPQPIAPTRVSVSVKVKVTLVQALRLCTGRTAHMGSRSIVVPFLDHGTRKVWGVSVTPRPLFTPKKDPVPIVQEAGRAPVPVWTGAENLASNGIRSPDRPASNQSLYRLRYPAHNLCFYRIIITAQRDDTLKKIDIYFPSISWDIFKPYIHAHYQRCPP
jgi:hypothetical protein